MNITFYNSTEEMLDDLSRAMQEADEQVKLWQAEIKKGDCFWRDTEYGFQIYGKVLKKPFCSSVTRRNENREEHLRHYRFCKYYSEVCPDGELGDVHVSVISGLLTREEFEEKIRSL
jgi:hypothetical protein